MAQEDAVSKAKSELSKASDLTKSVEGKTPSMFAKPAPSPNVSKPAAVPAPTAGGGDGGVRDMNQKTAAEEGAKIGMKSMPIMHKGGTVKEDGPAMLQKGEQVIAAPKAAKMNSKSVMTKDEGHKAASKAKTTKKHNGFKKTTITHHTDGSHSVEHEHENHPKHSVSGSHADLNGVHDSLEANIGQGSQPDMPQAQPQMADAGAPAGAAPAPAAAPAMAAPAPVMA